MASKIASIEHFVRQATPMTHATDDVLKDRDLSNIKSKIRHSDISPHLSPSDPVRSRPPLTVSLTLLLSLRHITAGGMDAWRFREGEILRKLPGDIDGQPFDLTSLRRCEVALLDRSEAVQVDELTDCR